MPSLNKVFLMGNLTRDPEVRVTPARMSVADFGLAVSRRFRTGSGEEKEDRCFVSVTAWGGTAEAVGRSLRRGDPVFVEGRLKFDEWERDGVRHNRLSVVAERIRFLSAPKRDAQDPADLPPSMEPAAGSEPDLPAPPAGPGDADDLPF